MTYMSHLVWCDLLGLDLDGLGAVSEVPAVISEAGTRGVNVLCPHLVSEVLLQLELVGAEDPVCPRRDKHGVTHQ